MKGQKALRTCAEAGRMGGKARAARMTPAQRSEAARKAVLARWEKNRKQCEEILKRHWIEPIREALSGRPVAYRGSGRSPMHIIETPCDESSSE